MVRRVTTKSVVEEAQSIGLGMGEACAVSPQDASVWWGQLWRAAFDDALSAMMIVDADCNIVAINRAMEEMTGWSEGSALGRGCWELPGFGGGECSSLEGDCRALAGKKAAGTRTARRSRVTSKREGEPCVEHLPLHASTQATGYRLVTASEA